METKVYAQDKLKKVTATIAKDQTDPESENNDDISNTEQNGISTGNDSDSNSDSQLEEGNGVVQGQGPRNNVRYNLRACPQPPVRYRRVLAHVLSVI